MPTDVDRIAEVLNAHWSASTHSNHNPIVDKCDGCGEVILTWGGEGDSFSRLAVHQADQLTAAGIGHVPTALHQAADDLEESAEVIAVRSSDLGIDNGETTSTMTTDADWLRARADAVTEGAG